MDSNEELLQMRKNFERVNVVIDELQAIVFESEVNLARYGYCMSPVQVQIGKHVFLVIGNSATLLSQGDL